MGHWRKEEERGKKRKRRWRKEEEEEEEKKHTWEMIRANILRGGVQQGHGQWRLLLATCVRSEGIDRGEKTELLFLAEKGHFSRFGSDVVVFLWHYCNAPSGLILGKAPSRAVHTGSLANQYVDHLLLGGTVEIGRWQSIEGERRRRRRRGRKILPALPWFPRTVRRSWAKNRRRAIPSPRAGRRNEATLKQGLQFRSIPLVPGGTDRSARLSIRGLPATGRYRQNRPSTVNFGRRRSIKGEIDRRRSIEGEKGKKKKKKEVPRAVLAHASPLLSLAGDFSPVRGDGTSPRVATFIVEKILLDNLGLQHICATFERFIAVVDVLANMVVSHVEQPSTRLLKHIIRCYLRLSENGRSVLPALTRGLPAKLKDGTFILVSATP
ncbi:hypothetical protein GW17_00002302 [Ensete ventricosum]|nr:hypothetical protein GW17_00002302 [Ensete ventricosum]